MSALKSNQAEATRRFERLVRREWLRTALIVAGILFLVVAAAGVFSFAGLLALVRSVGASRPFASMSILESIERDAAVRAARMRALSADGSVKPSFAPDSRQNRAAA
jgi:hypothetical protein